MFVQLCKREREKKENEWNVRFQKAKWFTAATAASNEFVYVCEIDGERERERENAKANTTKVGLPVMHFL